jgi:cell division protein FtsQ
VLGGIVTLLIAANRKSKEHLCKGVVVSINNGGDKIFVKQDDVQKTMENTAKGSLIKKHIGEINLTQLEKTLEASPWIRDAELYFDTKDVLHVAVSERVPVARVFTTAGVSFYMDSSGYKMPLLETYGAKLPVVTGFTASKKWSLRDSAIVKGIKNITRYVTADPFWNAQIGQIDITPDGKFEAVPTIGSHLIKLGYGDNIEDKLARLLLFYKQVLSKAGFAKYSALDVQFDGQVIGVKGPLQSPIDSIQLQKNIVELMRKKASEQEAEGMLPDESLPIAIAPVVDKNRDSLRTLKPTKEPAAVTSKISNPPTPKKSPAQKSNVKTPAVNKPGPAKQKEQNEKGHKAKAVMPNKNEY